MRTPAEIEELLEWATPAEREEIDALLASDKVLWRPLPGPQMMAYYSTADIVGYGGAAGGGKTELAIGKALTRHRKVAMFRRVGTELTAIEDRVAELIGNTTGYNGQKKIWRNPVPGVQLEFGSVPNLGDEKNYQGRPKDLLVLDEAANFLESQARFLMGWVRSTVKGQQTQTLMCFNPPTSSEGRWIIGFFAPWLDPKHPKPAKPGELRWYAVIAGRDTEVLDNRPFVLEAVTNERVYTFQRAKFRATDIISPQSRTFIPSSIADNPYLYSTGYMTQLQALPEPLRSQMLYGDFQAGMEDDEYQVIPTEWVEAAMARWKPLDRKPPMDNMGVDVARGGADNTVIARRHDNWFDKPLVKTGRETPDGPSVAAFVVSARRDNAPICLDVIGVGASPYDFLSGMGLQIQGINVSERATRADKSGMMHFYNLRSQLVWMFREMLDPASNLGVALPNDSELKADLCAFTWKPQGKVIKVASRDEIVAVTGRSPDWASAYILAAIDVPKIGTFKRGASDVARREHDPYTNMN